MPARKTAPAPAVIDVGPTERDYVMARLAAARVAAQDAVGAIDEAMGMFVHTDEDTKGTKRGELVQVVLEALGDASRAMESAEEAMEDIDPEEREPWEEDDEDEPDDDSEDGDDDDE